MFNVSLSSPFFPPLFIFFPSHSKNLFSFLMCRLAWLWLTTQQLPYRTGKQCKFSYALWNIIWNAIFPFLFLWYNLFSSKFTQSYFCLKHVMLRCQVLLLVSLLLLCSLVCNIHLNGKLFSLIVSISVEQMLVYVFFSFSLSWSGNQRNFPLLK